MPKTYRCPECTQRHFGRNIYSTKPQPDSLCEDCHKLKQPLEYESTYGLRCPMCGESEQDDLFEIPNIYIEGENNNSCPDCTFEYTFETVVTTEWTSPERVRIHHGHTGIPCQSDDDSEWMPLSNPDHRFQCTLCERWCCACFGSACEVDEVQDENRGICCDCWASRQNNE